MMNNFGKTIKKIELKDDQVVAMKGSCKASDLQPGKDSVVDDCWDEDVFVELGLKRLS